jgi:glycosyltransferase involved in cell wall biosynthesis
MRRWARGCSRLLLLAETQRERAAELLGVDPKLCTVVPNGFAPGEFSPQPVDRRALWNRYLVQEPRGWRPGQGEGSVRYDVADIERITDGTVLLCVGRFTEVKRTGLLVRAFARAQENFETPASLVFVGGHPGEWEGEHPVDVVAASGARDVFLAGWHDHDSLPEILNAADALVLASVREQFGSVLVEAMACGLPAVAVDRFGPAEVVTHGQTGWLVEPDDELGLAAALAEVVNRPDERERRAEVALRDARDRFAWPALGERVAAVFTEVTSGTTRGDRLTPSTT